MARRPVREGDRDGPGGGRGHDGIGELGPEAGHEIDLGEGLAQLVAVALGHAARHDQAGSRSAPVGQGQDGVDRLLAGGIDERARVDHDEIGRLRVRGGAVALCSEIALQLVGVDLVLRAPQGLQPVEAHDVTHSSHQAGSRRGDRTRQARLCGPTIRIVRHHVPDPRAEREGFEPSDPVTQVKSLAVTPIRPLSHLSSRTFKFGRDQLSRACPRPPRVSPCGEAYVKAGQGLVSRDPILRARRTAQDSSSRPWATHALSSSDWQNGAPSSSALARTSSAGAPPLNPA